jgi:hypothetical protein
MNFSNNNRSHEMQSRAPSLLRRFYVLVEKVWPHLGHSKNTVWPSSTLRICIWTRRENNREDGRE